MPRCLLAALVLFVPLGHLRAQEPARTHDVTIDDYFSLALITQSRISPDGAHVAYSEARWQKATSDRKSDLWIVDAKTSKSRRLTFDRCNPRTLTWSGTSVLFLANRKREAEKAAPWDGKTQVWSADVAGGSDPRPVTQVEGGVEAFQLTADGRSLFYVIHTDSTEDEWRDLRGKHGQIDYGHGVNRVSQLWRLDLETWKAEKVVDANRFVYEIAATPDGARVAMITAPDDRVVHFEGKSRVDVWDAKSNKVQTVPDKVYRKDAKSPYAWLENVAISPDGKTVAFNAVWDGYPTEVVLGFYLDNEWAQSQLMRRPTLYHIRGYGSPLAFTTAKELAFLAEQKGHVKLARFADVDQESSEIIWGPSPLEAVISQFSFDSSGKVKAMVVSTPSDFADVWLWDAKGARRLTNVNAHTATWKLGVVKKVEWKGTNGDTVEGILELPPGYKEGQKIPLVVDIHGGPTTAYYHERMFAWFSGRTVLPAKGYAVLQPNYRGSTGYGDKFLIDLVGKENDYDVQDILKGVDQLVADGIADPNKLAVMGWSNGGYLTNCCIANTTRFKAAISGAGILDAMMEFGSNDEPAYSIVFKKGFPWTPGNTYQKASPSWQLDKVKTPTLIHVGGGDERCPPGHSRMLHRILKEYNNVPTELLVYPGEPHGLRKYSNIQAKMEWDQAWLSRFVLGTKK
jgi:dipeptidyl aminopeptidase/acylaminoacyl peptidase